MTHKTIPVSLLVGFLGSGKTTLLNAILSQNHGRKMAVIVNEIGEINVDARLVRHTTERTVEMSNGCICCTLRDDLLQELRDLSRLEDLEYILIEATGVAAPIPIARTFYTEDLLKIVHLDSIITMVDAVNFWHDFNQEIDTPDEDEASVSDPLASLLAGQIEFSNIVLINKSDLVTEEDLVRLESFVRHLNAEARVFRTVQAGFDANELIGRRLYDYEKGAEADDWAAEKLKLSSYMKEHGFASFVFRSDVFLQWEPFEALLSNGLFENVARSKGVAFFEDHPPVFVSQAGNLCQIEELPPLTPEELNDSGDPFLTELVFIGMDMPQQMMLDELGACRLEKAAVTQRIQSG